MSSMTTTFGGAEDADERHPVSTDDSGSTVLRQVV